MTEQEVYKKIQPLLEGFTEGVYWDFKKTLTSIPDIIKDILAFSNSNYEEDSYIIVGVSESDKKAGTKIALSTADRRRLNTDSNYLYVPGHWDVHSLSADDIVAMKQFSAKLTEQIEATMLIGQPQCEYIPVELKKNRWLFVIVIKHSPGVFISKKDIFSQYDGSKVVVKQGVLYVRMADTTLGARTDVAMATEHIRVWKRYLDWLENKDAIERKAGDER